MTTDAHIRQIEVKLKEIREAFSSRRIEADASERTRKVAILGGMSTRNGQPGRMLRCFQDGKPRTDCSRSPPHRIYTALCLMTQLFKEDAPCTFAEIS